MSLTKSNYAKDEVEACGTVLRELITDLEPYRDYFILVGGWVPFFLTDCDERKKVIHVGSKDIDLALDVGKLPDTAGWEIAEILEKQGYQAKANLPYRYFRKVELSGGRQFLIRLDFLTSKAPLDEKSEEYQPMQGLSAHPEKGIDLVFNHCLEKEIGEDWPPGSKDRFKIKIADMVACLATKGIAIASRHEAKDAYDIYILSKHYPGGPETAASALKPFKKEKLVQDCLSSIRQIFQNVDSAGPISVAKFLELETDEEKEAIIGDSFEVVNEILG
ncbi:MAG: nucleotidyl transferase AbiEii/AbiGii toxin family protein [bacterium]